MSRKNNLLKFQTITAGDMSAASITSAVTNIQFLDNIGLQLNFSGSPVGLFQVQISADYAQDNEGNVQDPGNWVPMVLTYLVGSTFVSATTVPTSSGSPIALDLNQLSFPWIRVVYTKTSGTGTLNAFITCKMV